MYVAIDANALSGDWSFRSRLLEALCQYIRDTKSRLLLHDIVKIELEENFKRECMREFNNLESARRRLEQLGIEGLLALDRNSLFSGAFSDWEKKRKETFTAEVVEPLSIDGTLMEEVVRRLAQRIPPSSAKGEEFRDCAIWISLLKYASENPNKGPFVLISSDGDFSTDKELLRPELQKELEERKVTILYYSSIKNFLEAHGAALPVINIREGAEMDLTGGSLTVQGISGGPVFEFQGPDFTIRNEGADHGNVGAWHCSPCRTGQRVNLNSTFAGELGLGYGRCTIGGKKYPRLYYSGQIHFYGEAEIEELALSEARAVGPFTFAGLMKGYENNPFSGDPGTPVFEVELRGKGTAWVQLSRSSDAEKGALFFFRKIAYEFLE